MDLSLRDQIAIAAMQGLLSHSGWHPDFIFPDSYKFEVGSRADDAVSRAAYAYADAMIRARNQS